VTRIIQPGRNAWQQASTEAGSVVIDAADYYNAFYWAAAGARHSILMSGWQFDSGVPLLRGVDAPRGTEVRFLRFLNELCEERPSLHIRILAWDFHLAFAPEREWLQRVIFHWMTNSRLHFRFDKTPAPGGSHHQKFVVIDGRVSFLGGMDVCEARWDDRRHRAVNPARLSRGRPTKPYHDVQACLIGTEAAGLLQRLFVDRWTRAGGEPFAVCAGGDPHLGTDVRRGVSFGPTRVSFSRTDPRPDGQTVREVEHLYLDGIEAAQRLIYIETQYFSSRIIREALIHRMRAEGRPSLDIAIVVNERAEALKEELAVGLRQAKNLETLAVVARETGHALGCYYSLCDGANETFRTTYIHSKVMVIDDRFLTIGSANMTNRSMGVDSELHASCEARAGPPDERRLICAIRRVRISLLAEHGGLSGPAAVWQLRPASGLIARLDALTRRPGARLQRHGPPNPVQQAVLGVVDPEKLPFDPETSEEDRFGQTEPADEPGRRRLAGLRSGIAARWSRLSPNILRWLPIGHRAR
jgi:phospholipase D1/2